VTSALRHEARGDAHQGFRPGTIWAQIPSDWACPDCAVNEKADFQVVTQADQR